MKEKINWYQEVLELEPGSKVFFPLARLLAESGQTEKAVRTLCAGLDRHPEFMEARLYLIDLLFRAGHLDSCNDHLQVLTPLFARYTGFWQAWSKRAASLSQDDSEFALAFLATVFRQGPLTLAEVLKQGLRHLAREEAASERDAAPACPLRVHTAGEEGPLAETARQPVEIRDARGGSAQEGGEDGDDGEEERFSLRTRSMAEVLAEQGDPAGALEIYQELLANAASPEETIDFNHRISMLSAQLGEAQQQQAVSPEPAEEPRSGRRRVLSVLEALAERLESRVHG